MFNFFRRNQNTQNQRPQRTGGQRAIGMGLNYVLPGLGLGARAYFNANNAGRDVLSRAGTTSYGNPLSRNSEPSSNLGFAPSQPVGPSAPVQAPIAQAPITPGYGQNIGAGMAGAMSGIGAQQGPNTQQQISQMPIAMQQWIRHNGLPQTADDIRRATNSMYLDQSVDIANARYGEDIGFVSPFSSQPRER